jgi:hypothetical protein
LPGFVAVGVVVLVEVDVLVEVEVDVLVVVGVVVVVVVVDVEYWSACAELSPTEVAYPRPPSPTSGKSAANVTTATTTIRRRRRFVGLIRTLPLQRASRIASAVSISAVSVKFRCK